jgi:hypothetical protein
MMYFVSWCLSSLCSVLWSDVCFVDGILGYVCSGGQCVSTTFIAYRIFFPCCTNCRDCLLFSSGVKPLGRENDRLPLFSAEILPYVSMAWCLSSGTASLYLNREGPGTKRVRYYMILHRRSPREDEETTKNFSQLSSSSTGIRAGYLANAIH